MKAPPTLYVTDGEIAKVLGVSTDKWKQIATVLSRKGLPPPSPLFENRRYWPAVKAFLDRRHGLQAPLYGNGRHARTRLETVDAE